MKRLLPIVAVTVVLAAAVVGAGEPTYVGAEKCKMCHRTQFSSWETTTHAKSTEAAKSGAADQGLTYGADCLKCHATNADENLPGVQCEACHGPGSEYKKMSIMKDLEKAMANGLILATQETCDQCHVDDGHSKTVSFDEQIDNKAAIHEFKKDPRQYLDAAGM